jgi:serine/threonine protein kinase
MTQTTHQNALPLGSMLMEYRLQSVLGAGGFGITYLAHDTNLQKDVAIKEYLPSAVAVRGSGGTVLPTTSGMEKDYRWGLDRFIQEARTLAKFSHPHIVRVNRFFEANGTGYMVMDYEAGEPLKAWLQRNPFPPEPALRAMLAPLLDGLEKVHAAGFLHRDIKPDNIFIRKDGGPVLIDFGSARQAVGGATQTLTTIVSPGYAPFEQYTTSAEQGPWSDIYSLSGVLFFAIAGQSPPDAITRMKSDALNQGLGAARMRYSGPFVDAVGWGLALEEGSRPRNIVQWREVLFGQRPMTAPAVAAQASSPGAKNGSVPRAAQSPSKPPATVAAEAIARARAMDMGTAPGASGGLRLSERGGFPWKTMVVAVAGIAMLGVGLRTMRPHPPTNTPTVVVLNSRQLVGPGAEAHSPTVALQPPQPTSPAPVAAPQPIAAEASVAPHTEPQPFNPQAASTATDNSAASPAARPVGEAADAQVAAPAWERKVEARFHAADADNTGLTREEMARNFPRLAARFDEIDTNHNGRIEASELSAALQQLASQARGSQ